MPPTEHVCRTLGRVAVVVTCFWLALAGVALAHPLGNFTTNRFSALEIGPTEITIRYVVDFAEVAAFQELANVDSDGDGHPSSPELQTYAAAQGELLLTGIRVTADDAPIQVRPGAARAMLRAGQGALDTLRLEVDLIGALPPSAREIHYVDANYASKIGWKEVIATAVDGQGIVASSVPSASSSDELRTYPAVRSNDLPQVTAAEIEIGPQGASGSTPSPREPQSTSGEPGLGGSFASLIETRTTALAMIVGVLLAVGFGALHALGPGHGKAVMAAYLVGTEGRVRHAVLIGVAVSVMHTASVVALGLITLWAADALPPETVYPWLSLSAGLAVIGVGAWLLWTRLRERGEAHGHAHDHGAQASPLSARGLVAIALSGGLLPSPTALVVLLGAVALERVTFGIALVAGFSVGLAAALTLLGIAVLRTREATSRRLGAPVTALVRLGAAAAVIGIGLFLTVRALTTF